MSNDNPSIDVQAESSRRGSIASARCVKTHLFTHVSGEGNYHAQTLASYIFSAGYVNSAWADIQLVFFGQDVKLHRRESSTASRLTIVILARSPFLYKTLMNYQPGATIHLTFPDENITPEVSPGDYTADIVRSYRPASPLRPCTCPRQRQQRPVDPSRSVFLRRNARTSPSRIYNLP